MATKRGISRAARAKQLEMEERIRQMRQEEDHIKAKIHKLEASIVAAPVWQAGSRLANRNLIQADDVWETGHRAQHRTRWQAQRLNRARSRQAVTALMLVAAFVGFVFWFYLQLRTHGVL